MTRRGRAFHDRSSWKRVRDWLLYVGIAVLIVAVIVLFAMHSVKAGGSPDLPLKWMAFVGVTAIMFGYAVRAWRRSWRQPRFWLLLIVFAVVHSGLGTFG